MRNAAVIVALVGLMAPAVGAQGRGNGRQQGTPPGHMPPPGECRVWYDGRPPGRQPAPTSCREAERIASRDRYARVIYGGDRRDDRWERDDDRRGRAVPGYPDRYPRSDDRRYPVGRGEGYNSIPFDKGYKDGFDKGREDARDNDRYDPRGHRWYRSADRGYDNDFGSRDQYKNVYREGFLAGYEEGYRRPRDNGRWPF